MMSEVGTVVLLLCAALFLRLLTIGIGLSFGVVAEAL
jgi:hypothetical protein